MVKIRGVLLQGVFYLLVVVVACVVILLSLFSTLAFFDILLLIIGLCMGAFASYVMFHSFTQEKTIKLFPGENLIIKSSGPGSYVTIKHIGDKVFENDPLKADLYLTSMGIIAEKPDSGSVMLFIAHDKVLEYVPYEAGIIVRYLDVNDQFSESILHVEDRNAWINAMYKMYSNRTGRI